MSDSLAAKTVTSPIELAALLREIKEAVAAGTLRQVRPDPSPSASHVDIGHVPEAGPWPDYLELRFDVVGTRVRYRLEVETYHGSGGSWGPE